MNIRSIVSEHRKREQEAREGSAKHKKEQDDLREANAAKLDDAFRAVIEPALKEAAGDLTTEGYPAKLDYLPSVFTDEKQHARIFRIKMEIARAKDGMPSWIFFKGDEYDLTVEVETKASLATSSSSGAEKDPPKPLPYFTKKKVEEIIEGFVREVFGLE